MEKKTKKIKSHGPVISNKDLVTLDEMLDIFWNDDSYAKFRKDYCLDEYKKKRDGLPYIPLPQPENVPLVYQHINAEEFLSRDYKEIEWADYVFFNPYILIRLVQLWVNPLMWTLATDYINDIVIEGRVAKEKYNILRNERVREIVNYVKECTILEFADHFSAYESEEMSYAGYTKNIHMWEYVTRDFDLMFDDIIWFGKKFSAEEVESVKAYNAAALRNNLLIVARERGGLKAAELLHTLQNEWKQIKIWKPAFEHLKIEDIKQFEETIMHGFDDLLAEWEAEPSHASTSSQQDVVSYAFITQTAYSKEIIDIIESYQKGKSNPRDLMMPIRAAMDAGVIRRPTFKDLQEASPIHCPKHKSSVSEYTNPDKQPYSEEAYKTMVEEFQKLA